MKNRTLAAIAALNLAAWVAGGCGGSEPPEAEYPESSVVESGEYDAPASENESDDAHAPAEGESLAARALDLYGLVLFKCAWPTAHYEGYEILKEPELSTDGNAVSVALVQLEGTSAFSGGPLWVKVEVSMSVNEEGEPELFGLRFGDNNAQLAQPGTTVRSRFISDLSPGVQKLVEKVCPNPP